MSFVRSVSFFVLLPLVACQDPIIGSWELDTMAVDGCTVDGDLVIDDTFDAEFDIRTVCMEGTDRPEAHGDVEVKGVGGYTMNLVSEGDPFIFDCDLEGDTLTCDGVSFEERLEFQRID